MPSSRYTVKMAQMICARIAEGESLSAICRDPKMPCMTTVMNWLCAKPDFRERYARARELQADTLFDQILAISDEAFGDGAAGAGEPAQRAKLKIESRKVLPERFARIEVRLDGLFEQLKDLNSSIRWMREPADYASRGKG